MQLEEIDAGALDALLQTSAPCVVLDVREVEEQASRPFAGALSMPLGLVLEQMDTLDKSANIVTLCVSGRRSAMACHLLQEAGFARVKNLKGGINAWDAYLDAQD
ncbi:MAG: rhodanese-like domain-containing protein [Proteobacteria bacterium]|nr:rhodanese-like domain-containing protein [Pseudomonadota bacterium]